MRRVERGLDVRPLAARDLTDHLAGDRGDIVETAPVLGRHPFAADEVVVALRKRSRHRSGGVCLYVHQLILSNLPGAPGREDDGSAKKRC